MVMGEGRVLGRAARGAVVAVVVLVIGELGLLTFVHHLDDDLDAQYAAYTRTSGILSGIGRRPSPEVASATGRAVQGIIDSGVSADAQVTLAESHGTWIADPRSDEALTALRAETAAIGGSISRSQRRIDLLAAGLQAGVLAAFALAWFAWSRRLTNRHARVEHELTQRQSMDSDDRRLTALVRNSADVITVLDHDSTVLFASPSAGNVLGILSEQLVGRRIVDMVSTGDAATLARHLVTQRAGDHSVSVRLGLDDGRDRVLHGTLTNLSADLAINGWVLTLRDVTDRHALEEQLAQQAFHDGLTGLANRQLFNDRLEHALARQAERGEPIVVLICDLDDFKHVNDSRGHSAGDHLLTEVGSRLLGALGPGDTVARLGGDEFALILEGRNTVQAERVARRIQEMFAEPFRVDGIAVAVQASIGIAEAVAGGVMTTGEELLRNADVAMCWAKDRGKGTVALYESGLHALALERLAIRSELQYAIREEQFILHFQPTVDLTTEAITGFEALVRWQHPSRGLLAPKAFISIAEQSGLIVELGSWVLREACRAAVSLQTPIYQPTMSVNIAAQQVVQSEFVELVVSALEDSGLPAHYLVLEITESVLLDDMAGAVERLASLRALGVHVAIDDFGTGYSSLAYLSRLPVDILKVDKSFVDEVCDGSHGASVTEAIIAMSQTMRLVTVAEGVELPEQAAWLQQAACTLGQGFLWSRPVELAGAHHLLRAGVPRQRSRNEAPRPRHAWRPSDPVI
ncbi:MAG: putative bifunctional diguanylate cyclase/phosphodiesterase [Nocardioides sp.]